MIHVVSKAVDIFSSADPQCVHSILGIPPWYEYLNVQYTPNDAVNSCTPAVTNINDLWLIGLAVIDILTRIAILVSIGFVLYAGIKYSESRANAEKVEKAKSTLIDALTGLVISIIATASIAFIAGRFTQ